jgi:hypothetical protein
LLSRTGIFFVPISQFTAFFFFYTECAIFPSVVQQP